MSNLGNDSDGHVEGQGGAVATGPSPPRGGGAPRGGRGRGPTRARGGGRAPRATGGRKRPAAAVEAEDDDITGMREIHRRHLSLRNRLIAGNLTPQNVGMRVYNQRKGKFFFYNCISYSTPHITERANITKTILL